MSHDATWRDSWLCRNRDRSWRWLWRLVRHSLFSLKLRLGDGRKHHGKCQPNIPSELLTILECLTGFTLPVKFAPFADEPYRRDENPAANQKISENRRA